MQVALIGPLSDQKLKDERTSTSFSPLALTIFLQKLTTLPGSADCVSTFHTSASSCTRIHGLGWVENPAFGEAAVEGDHCMGVRALSRALVRSWVRMSDMSGEV